MTRQLVLGWVMAALVCLFLLEPREAIAVPLGDAPRVDAEGLCGDVRGVVTRSDDGLGIRKVRMVLRRDGSRDVVSVQRSGKGGRFTFEDLPSGVYSLEARAVGFLPAILAPIVVRPGKEMRIEHVTLTPIQDGRSDS